MLPSRPTLPLPLPRRNRTEHRDVVDYLERRFETPILPEGDNFAQNRSGSLKFRISVANSPRYAKLDQWFAKVPEWALIASNWIVIWGAWTSDGWVIPTSELLAYLSKIEKSKGGGERWDPRFGIIEGAGFVWTNKTDGSNHVPLEISRYHVDFRAHLTTVADTHARDAGDIHKSKLEDGQGERAPTKNMQSSPPNHPPAALAAGGFRRETERSFVREHIVTELTAHKHDFSKLLILMGAPGSGKSYKLNELCKLIDAKLHRTTFHPELSHGEFVGVYKPVPLYVASHPEVFDAQGNEITGKLKKMVPIVAYQYQPGPFLEAYVEAKLNPEQQVVLIIEEINRANPSAVFGDILQLLDINEYGVSEYPIDTSSDMRFYLGTQGIEDPNLLAIPANLHIWGTMNRADESVNYIDSAFLRRWDIEYVPYDKESKFDGNTLSVGGKDVTWGEFRAALNGRLSEVPGVEDDKFIGPYFLKAHELKDRAKVFSKLITYLWHDVVPMEREQIFKQAPLSELYHTWMGGGSILEFEI